MMVGARISRVLLLAAFTCLSKAAPSYWSITKCPITKDGRVSLNTTLQTFDTPASPFNDAYSKGQNLSWSQIILFPQTAPAKYDFPTSKAIEVTINDSSVFVPGGGQPQIGFRRAGLLMGNGSDATNIGVKTFHWSVKQDPQREMNLTHEYLNAWHEANDYSSNQFSFNTGIMLEQDKPTDSNISTTGLSKYLWKFLDRDNDVIWTTRIDWQAWQNFAVTVDYNENTLQIYYSRGYDTLQPVTGLLPNDNSGGGQFQIGILKKPTNTVGVVYDGYQESGIHEGQIYGSIFIEDSSGGCVST